MWFFVALALTAQADDILSDVAKPKSSQVAPAEAPPSAGKTPDLPVPPAGVKKDEAKPGEVPPAGEAAKSAGGNEPAKNGDSATAEESAPPVRTFAMMLDEITNTGALGDMRKGGFFMWPILLLGIVALGVIIERSRALLMLTAKDPVLRAKVQNLLQEDRAEEALAICEREKGPVPAILGAGLRKYVFLKKLNYDSGQISDQVSKAMEDYAVHVVAALEKHLPVLATVASAAPMIGFLGTVSGMVQSFRDIVAQRGVTDIVTAAAAGIEISLLTTVLGLLVGIPAFVGFNYFTSVTNTFVLDVEESSAELIETVTLQMALADKPSS